MAVKLDFHKIEGERSRTYHWPDGKKFTVKGVKSIHVRPSGSHRLECSSATKFIIPAGWIAIEIDADAWSL